MLAPIKVKVGLNVKSSICYSVYYARRTQDQKRFYNFESGNQLGWANDTAAHHAVIQCRHQRTLIGPAVCS